MVAENSDSKNVLVLADNVLMDGLFENPDSEVVKLIRKLRRKMNYEIEIVMASLAPTNFIEEKIAEHALQFMVSKVYGGECLTPEPKSPNKLTDWLHIPEEQNVRVLRELVREDLENNDPNLLVFSTHALYADTVQPAVPIYIVKSGDFDYRAGLIVTREFFETSATTIDVFDDLYENPRGRLLKNPVMGELPKVMRGKPTCVSDVVKIRIGNKYFGLAKNYSVNIENEWVHSDPVRLIFEFPSK